MIGRRQGRRGRVGGGLVAGLLALGLAVEIVGAPSAAHLADLGAVAALAVADCACRDVLAAGEVFARRQGISKLARGKPRRSAAITGLLPADAGVTS